MRAIALALTVNDIASGQKGVHSPHSDRPPTTLESETLYDTPGKSRVIGSNVDRTDPHPLVATSIDGQVLPRSKLDKAAFANAMVLKVAFLLVVPGLPRLISTKLSVVVEWGYDDVKENPTSVPIRCECLIDLRSLYESKHSLVETDP
jgi:hypothetical protein